MKSAELLYSRGENDECYTPAYGVRPIIKYAKRFKTIWCPFDTQQSQYVIQLKDAGHRVIASHIDTGKDFFQYAPRNFDAIISNPPFTGKRFVFERALSFGKPIALLMTNAWLNDKYSKWVFKEAGRQMQLLMFDKRIHFVQGGVVDKRTTFSSSYFCSNMLPNDIVLEELEDGKH